MNPKKWATSLFTGVAVLGGMVAGLAGVASAQTVTADTSAVVTQPVTQSAATTGQPARNPSKAGHVGKNGTREALLTGDTAAQVTAAALAAVPGGTIDRVETDAEGAAYEAHMTKADGTRVTLKFDTSFNVTATESGFGPHQAP